MIIFLYGQDTFRLKQKLAEIIDEYQKVHKSGLNLKIFDKGINFDDLKNEIFSFSMFKEKKLIILKNIFDDKIFKEKFISLIKKIKDFHNIILILCQEGEVSLTDPLFKELKKTAKSQEFKKLEGLALKNWIKKETEKLGALISPEAVEKLIAFLGNDSWQISNEMKKLITFKKKKTVQSKDIELLTKPEVENNIFKTIDAIAEKNKKRAAYLIHQHLEKGDSPLYLMAMINSQFRNLLVVTEMIGKNVPYYLIRQKTQMKPFLFEKTWRQSRKFTLRELKNIYWKIFKLDLEIKTGKIDPITALDLLLSQI